MSQFDVLATQVEIQQLAINRLTEELAALAAQTAEARAVVPAQTVDSPIAVDRWLARGESARPWCLYELDAMGRERLVASVVEWLDWLLERYPLRAVIPTCWAEHPEMVEELVAAHAAWQAAYCSDDASPYAPAEWHERWLPGL